MIRDVASIHAWTALLASLLLFACVYPLGEGRLVAAKTSEEEVILPDVCTSDSDCPNGFSCWHELPRGPSAGIPGSEEKPGKCYRNGLIKKIF